MYYFYIIVNSVGRVGFGITSSPSRRLKDYTGHWGERAEFAFLFQGTETHVVYLEKIIKRMYPEKLQHIDAWKMEWCLPEIAVGDFHLFVTDLIANEGIRVEPFAQNFTLDDEYV